MIGELLVVFSIVGVICVFFIECYKFYMNNTKLKNFYHAKGLPIIGNALNIVGKNNEEILEIFSVDNDELIYTWLGPVLLVHIANPEDFQTILTSEKCLKKAFIYNFLYNRTGMLTSEPNIWKEHRRQLSPTLGPKMVNSFIPIFNEKFRKMVNLMERKINGKVDIQRAMFKAAVETIMSASYGVNWTMQNKRGDDMHNLILDLLDRLQKRCQRVWLWNPIFKFTQEYTEMMVKLNEFYRFIRGALEAKKMQLAEKLEHGEDELANAKEANMQNFLQKCLQLELENKWTDENLVEEMDTIFVGSVDTSATTMCGVTLMLAIHPEYQERVVDEMRDIFDDPDEPVTTEHISRMKFLEIVIKESIRHFPIIPFVGRECTADLKIRNGIIPKGSTIFLNILRMNKNPRFYGKNVHEFYPERFLPENCANWHPYLNIPFLAGPRNCIGKHYAWASLKIALSYILRRFKLTTDLKMEDIIIRPELLLKIGNINPIHIERREWKRT